jgi:hypothetical protein
MLLVLIGALMDPVGLFYVLRDRQFKRSMWLTRTVGRILTAPATKVKFADFWVADQMCSLAGFFQTVALTIHFLYGARFRTGFCTRGCHWIPRMFS